MIYFIQCGEGGPIKIGSTNSAPHARMAHFQLGCPYDLNLLGAVNGGNTSELALHQRLIRDHIRGEWFNASPEVLGVINDVLSAAPNVPAHLLGGLPVRRQSPRGTKHLRHFLKAPAIEGEAA